MAINEMYTYLTDSVADYVTEELSIAPHNILTELPIKNQVIHEYDNEDIDVVILTDVTYFKVKLQWDGIPADDAGVIYDLYTNSTKANGSERTFYWQHVDGHTYVVRFIGGLSRNFTHELLSGGERGISQIELRVTGRKTEI